MPKMSDTRTPKASGLESFLSSNPIVLLAAVAVSVATVVAGAMTYLTTEKIKVLEIQHQTEITDIKDKSRADLLAATQPLKEKVEDLNSRMSSIDRRLPGSGPA